MKIILNKKDKSRLKKSIFSLFFILIWLGMFFFGNPRDVNVLFTAASYTISIIILLWCYNG